MSDKVIIEITKEELEVLRSLDAAIGVAGNSISKALTHREQALIMRMVAQHPEPLEDGIYTRVHNLSISTVFVKDNMWSTHIEPQDGSLVLAESVGPEAAEWTRVADLPDVNEWL